MNKLFIYFLVSLFFSFAYAQNGSNRRQTLTSRIEHNNSEVARMRREIAGVETQLARERNPNQAAETTRLTDLITRHRSGIASFERDTVLAQDSLSLIDRFDGERIAMASSSARFLSCNSSTPPINLEEQSPYVGSNFQGPLFGVPRDNQDGLGTCYANTAKNLLVGLSRGRDVASFLDMALQYKKSTGYTERYNLDLGDPCLALRATQASGYCPQTYSHLENGSAPPAIISTSSLNAQPTYRAMSANLTLFRSFLSNADVLKQNSDLLSRAALDRAQVLFRSIAQNPSRPIDQRSLLNLSSVSDEAYRRACGESQDDVTRFIQDIGPLLRELKNIGSDANDLFDARGRLKDSSQLMQLFLTPQCVDPSHRRAVPPFYCSNDTDLISEIKNPTLPRERQITRLREHVVLSLMQGYPLGNSFSASPSRHVNSIVGLRYNSSSRSCQYLIRESLTGESQWQNESDIFNKIDGLTEVRRR